MFDTRLYSDKLSFPLLQNKNRDCTFNHVCFEKQRSANCLKHALNNLIQKTEYFTLQDFETAPRLFMKDILPPNGNINDWMHLFQNSSGFFDISIAHFLLTRSKKFAVNVLQRREICMVASFVGHPNFVGILLQSNKRIAAGHYNCIHHDKRTGNLYFFESLDPKVKKPSKIENEKQLRDILHDCHMHVVWHRSEDWWIDAVRKYMMANREDKSFQKIVLKKFLRPYVNYFENKVS